MLGVRASLGGQHPIWGTRNALAALGPSSYLEIIAPDRTMRPPPKDVRLDWGPSVRRASSDGQPKAAGLRTFGRQPLSTVSNSAKYCPADASKRTAQF